MTEIHYVLGDFAPIQPPRTLTAWELDVLRRLISSGVSQEAEQLRVSEECRCGCASIAFAPPEEHRLLAEAQAFDRDGAPMWLLLFANRDGRLAELEIQRADGKPIEHRPAPESLTLRTG